MNLKKISRLLVASSLLISAAALSIHAQNGYGREAAQPVDNDYTKKIAEYTTEKFFKSPLTDYLPERWGKRADPGAGGLMDSLGRPIVNATPGLPGWVQADVDALRAAIAGDTAPSPALVEECARFLRVRPEYFREYRIALRQAA